MKTLAKIWTRFAPAQQPAGIEAPPAPPWYDRTDALSVLDDRRKSESLNDEEFEQLRHWAREGYIVVRDVVPTSDIDEMQSDLDSIWKRDDAIDGLVIANLRLQPSDPPDLEHKELVLLNAATREHLQRAFSWRVHSFCLHSEATRRIFYNEELIRWCSLIFGTKAYPINTINFAYGSSQNLHQDTAVFYVKPMNYLIGIWLACENIHPESGPLVYYPGSQRESLFPDFQDYPKVNLRNCAPALIDVYYRYVEDISRRYPRKTFTPRKGEVFMWHPMMIHGGDAIRNKELTRQSYVCHYVPAGCDKSAEAVGPFNW
jgi:ectoine hydroxylase-related dioxygenase (phytanoyl-CoA dioxygenase family)